MSRVLIRATTMKKTLVILILVAVTAGVAWRTGVFKSGRGMSIVAASELQQYVTAKPPVPIVFTSRTVPASFVAPADEAAGLHHPGAISWTATEGRLRLLDVDGKLYELTAGRTLEDGSRLIDVMSPSVSVDGKRILFAGRKAAPDAGRWRIYQVNTDGSDLRQLTGHAQDPGCVATPPMRFAADGSIMSDSDRRRIDYDDVDPTDLGERGFAFVSSRLPDQGRDHTRRATQLWSWAPGESHPMALSANRNNDRWPVLIDGDRMMFSLWSRNREVVTADRGDIRPFTSTQSPATMPTDRWMGARTMIGGGDFGYAIKSVEPVWRPRPLFNGRVVFMTDGAGEGKPGRIAQADWGYITSSPSSLQPGADLPDTGGAKLIFGPSQDEQGRDLVSGTPSPCPGGSVVFSAAVMNETPGAFAIRIISDNWQEGSPASRVLFDDPALVDAEPVAVYARELTGGQSNRDAAAMSRMTAPARIELHGGKTHTGESGFLENLAVMLEIRSPIPWQAPSETRVDPQQNPLIPPPKNIKSIAFWAARRDRFDDPVRTRVPGEFEKLLNVPIDSSGELQTWLPADPLMPTVVAGLDAEGKIAKWSGKISDSAGRPGLYYAYAGDHYSGTRPNGYHYCNGCHTGHTFISTNIREKVK